MVGSYVLLTRSPLGFPPKRNPPFDLHVLGTPPAFVLSQDQTLHSNPFRNGSSCPSSPVSSLDSLSSIVKVRLASRKRRLAPLPHYQSSERGVRRSIPPPALRSLRPAPGSGLAPAIPVRLRQCSRVY